MKVGPHLLAILAFGAASTNVAVARHHHGHHGSVGTTGSQSGTSSQGVAKSPAATGGQQGSGPEVGVPDHVNADAADKGTAEKSGLRSKTLPNAAASPDDARAIHRAVVPGGIPQAGPGAEIDTRVTVHQGRDSLRISRALKDINVMLLKKTKTAVAPGTGLKIENIHNHHLGSPVGSDGGVHRNAIGVAVDKTAKSGATIGVAATTAITVAAPPGAGAIIRDSNTKAVGGNIPINNASPGAAQIGNHPSGTAAPAIATTNGPSSSGIGTVRPGSGNGGIGGPAKIAGGFIGGNSFRPKHP